MLTYNKKMIRIIVVYILNSLVLLVSGTGLLLLYRPKDLSKDCAFSSRLRFDLSFGMGMSDTITMVFRTLTEIDYECEIEIVGESEKLNIIVVIKLPKSIKHNCLHNKYAFTVMKKSKCLPICKTIGYRDQNSPYFVFVVKGRVRFKFLSNSSYNSDINADMYQVTATAARMKPTDGRCRRNETECIIERKRLCFTTGVVCDGIKNCGVDDWFDERKSDCGLPVEYLSYAPVIAVVAAVVCALLAIGHVLVRCLPPIATSFFIFNANEDNRLCIDPVFKSPERPAFDIEKVTRTSLIPIFSSSSSSDESKMEQIEATDEVPLPTATENVTNIYKEPVVLKRKTTMKTVTERIQHKFRSATGRGKSTLATNSEETATQPISK